MQNDLLANMDENVESAADELREEAKRAEEVRRRSNVSLLYCTLLYCVSQGLQLLWLRYCEKYPYYFSSLLFSNYHLSQSLFNDGHVTPRRFAVYICV
jgi:hypothetical protein